MVDLIDTIVYAGRLKDKSALMSSSSGGAFTALSDAFLKSRDAGHIIMDYSIHDAIEAGFNHVVFIIRKDIEKEFKEVIGERIASICASHNAGSEEGKGRGEGR